MTPPDYGHLVYDPQLCQYDPDGTGRPACDVSPSWLVEVPGVCEHHRGAAVLGCSCEVTDPQWVVCQPHLGELVLNVADSHGEPVVISTLPIERVQPC